MKKEKHGVPRYRPFEGIALFRQGFRPFFLGAGIWSVAAVGIWPLVFYGYLEIPSAFGPVAWHGHEMIFGYTAAVMAGFLLTAIPNWTGRLPLQGIPLMVLFGAWLAGRAGVMFSALLGPITVMFLDLSFLALLFAAVSREIIASRNWRNLPMPVILGVLLTANVLIHTDWTVETSTAAISQRLSVLVIILAICLIGGRIIPSFTRNWLAKRKETRLPTAFNRFDLGCLILSALAGSAWAVAPDHPETGLALLAAGVANFIRLSRWRGLLTLSEPLVWSLHIGFLWVPLGFLLLGLSAIIPVAIPASAGLHAFTAGAIGSMTLAVMTRAILGHTGRELRAGRITTAIYSLITLAASVRVTAPFAADIQPELLAASALLWCASFGIFTVRYGRILLAH